MRKYLIFIALLLVGCGGNGVEPLYVVHEGQPPGPAQPPAQPPVQHVPELIDLALSPGTVPYMAGNGNVLVTAEISFRDAGFDLQTLCIRMPDGTLIEFDEFRATDSGTFTEYFTMPTDTVGVFALEFWLVDQAGDSSDRVRANFIVIGNAQSSDWTRRLSGLPYALNDVVWDGSFFIAVGDGGLVLTSADGINWAERESATDANLNAVAACGPDIMAVGDGYVVLLSTDHGDTWVTKVSASSSYSDVLAIACNSTQVVIGGVSYGLAAPFINISEDRGDTWHYVGPWNPARVVVPTDLIYSNGHFIAVTTRMDPGLNEPWIVLSSDGWSWNSIPVLDRPVDFYTIIHDGSRFIIAGEYSTVLASFDGLNWTTMQTPVEGVDYHSAAWNGTKLLIAGGYPCFLQNCSPPDPPPPYGIASTDGGATWGTFNIDGEYLSLGLAFGNGRFVSVGASSPQSREGAIYTAD